MALLKSLKKASKKFIEDKKDSAAFRRKVAMETREIRRDAYLKQSKIQAKAEGVRLAKEKSYKKPLGERVRNQATKIVKKGIKKPVKISVKDLI